MKEDYKQSRMYPRVSVSVQYWHDTAKVDRAQILLGDMTAWDAATPLNDGDLEWAWQAGYK